MSNPSDRMRLKDKIIANIAKAIKAIQEYQFYSGQENSILLTNSDWQCHKLCENLDHALLHGLRDVTHGYWRMVIEFTRKGAVKEIQRIQNVTTDLGRGRAWIFMALNENLLESYLKCIADNTKFVKKFYAKEALVLDDQRMNLLLTLTSGLEMACFQMDHDVPYLDLSTYPPRSRSLSSEKRGEDDGMSTYSSDSIPSRRSVSGVEMLASTPESTKAMTDSDTSSVTSLDTNSVFMERSRTESLSLDSGCHVDAASLISKRTTPTQADNISMSSQGSSADVEPRLKRIEAIINVNEDVEEIESGLEVIRVNKAKGSKSRKKSKRAKVVDIAPMDEDVKAFPIDVASSPNIEFVEASILSSFKEAFIEEKDPFVKSEKEDNSSQHVQKESANKTSENCVLVTNQREELNVDNNRLSSPVEDESNLPKVSDKHIPIKDDITTQNCDENKIMAETFEDIDSIQFKRKIVSNSSFDELASCETKKQHHVEVTPKKETDQTLDRAIVFSSKTSQGTDNVDKNADEKYFVGLHEDEDFYKVRKSKDVSDPSGVNSAKMQDYVDFIVGDDEEMETVKDELSPLDLDKFDCKEEDYSIQLDNNILLCVMLDVFSDQDEQFEKMFCTCQGHTEGEMKTVFLLVSSRSLYLLRQRDTDHKFISESEIPFKEIDFLAISVSNQVINIVCTNRRKQYWLTTGNESLTRAITSCLSSAMERCEFSIPKLTVLTDATTQKICMRKYAAKETRLEPSEVTVEGYSLVYWEDPHSRKLETANKEGTLLFKTSDSTKTPGWKNVHVILRGGMLCVFNDMGDSKPQCFVRLGGDQCVGCRRSTTADREHCLELILSNCSPWQFAAANHIEVADWLQCLCKAVSEGSLMGDEIWSYLPCCSVLTHQKILMCHEDVQTSFFRTLGSANMEEVTGITIDPEVKNYCILEFESQEVSVSSEQWVLYFNSGAEMVKFTKAMSQCWEQQFQVEIPINTIEDAPLQARCQETSQHILKLFAMK